MKHRGRGPGFWAALAGIAGLVALAQAQELVDLVVRTDTVLSASGHFAGGHVAPGTTLTLDPGATVTVTFTRNFVVEGTLVSHPGAGVRHTVRFEDVDESAYVGGAMGPIDSDVGLWVTGAGRLDLAGAPKTAWTRLAGGASAGATALALSDAPAGWEAGDTVVVAPTSPPTVPGFSTQFDEVPVASVEGGTVRLARPLAYDHPAVDGRWTAEVFVLNRNLVIEGTPRGRAHVWISSQSPQSLAHVEIRYMGPQKADDPDASVLGRYPLHFHHSRDGSRGSVIEGVVVHHAGNRAFVAHASFGVTLDGTVAYDVTQTPYWWDPPVRIEQPRGVDRSNDSKDIVYHRALAALVRASPTFRGYRLAGFQVNAGQNLQLTDSVAVGVQGNKNSSGFHWPENQADEPWTFARNLAHNNNRDGIFTWQNTPTVHRISDFVAYHNGWSGVEHGAYDNSYFYEDLTLYGNQEAGIHLHAVGRNDHGGLIFRCVEVDGAGITRVGVRIDSSPVEGTPAHLQGVTLTGLKGPAFELTQAAVDKGDTIERRVSVETATCAAGEPPGRRPVVWLPIAWYGGAELSR